MKEQLNGLRHDHLSLEAKVGFHKLEIENVRHLGR